MHTCPKCNGLKILPMFMHIDDGVCYQCGGTGEVYECTLTDDGLNKDVVDDIFTLVKHVSEDETIVVSVYIWHEGTGKKSAGTGHLFESLVDRSKEIEDYGLDGIWYNSDIQFQTELHVELSVLRELWADYIRRGFVQVHDSRPYLHPQTI